MFDKKIQGGNVVQIKHSLILLIFFWNVII
jgi:hypothetical protein